MTQEIYEVSDVDRTFILFFNAISYWRDSRVFRLPENITTNATATENNSTKSEAIVKNVDAYITIPKNLRDELYIPDLYIFHLIKFEPLEFTKKMDLVILTHENELG